MEEAVTDIDDKPFATISNKRTLQFGIIAIVLVVLLIGTCTWTGARKGAIRRENALEAQYRDNQNELSSYIAGAREQFSAVLTQTAALERILTEAVKGRYEQNGTPQGGLINVLREAYPNLGDLSLYNRLVDFIQSKREAYKNVQSKLLDMIREYEDYLSESITRGWALSGYPSRGLEARVGDKVYKGEAALDQMKIIVLTKEAEKAYESGEDTPLDFSNPNSTTSSTAG
jgi:hypothetical protein